jgi:hypothetical protein
MSRIHNTARYVPTGAQVRKKINLEFLTYVQGENTGVEKVKHG